MVNLITFLAYYSTCSRSANIVIYYYSLSLACACTSQVSLLAYLRIILLGLLSSVVYRVLVSVVSFCCIMGALRNPSAPIPHDSLHHFQMTLASTHLTWLLYLHYKTFNKNVLYVHFWKREPNTLCNKMSFCFNQFCTPPITSLRSQSLPTNFTFGS